MRLQILMGKNGTLSFFHVAMFFTEFSIPLKSYTRIKISKHIWLTDEIIK